MKEKKYMLTTMCVTHMQGTQLTFLSETNNLCVRLMKNLLDCDVRWAS